MVSPPDGRTKLRMIESARRLSRCAPRRAEPPTRNRVSRWRAAWATRVIDYPPVSSCALGSGEPLKSLLSWGGTSFCGGRGGCVRLYRTEAHILRRLLGCTPSLGGTRNNSPPRPALRRGNGAPARRRALARPPRPIGRPVWKRPSFGSDIGTQEAEAVSMGQAGNIAEFSMTARPGLHSPGPRCLGPS